MQETTSLMATYKHPTDARKAELFKSGRVYIVWIGKQEAIWRSAKRARRWLEQSGWREEKK